MPEDKSPETNAQPFSQAEAMGALTEAQTGAEVPLTEEATETATERPEDAEFHHDPEQVAELQSRYDRLVEDIMRAYDNTSGALGAMSQTVEAALRIGREDLDHLLRDASMGDNPKDLLASLKFVTGTNQLIDFCQSRRNMPVPKELPLSTETADPSDPQTQIERSNQLLFEIADDFRRATGMIETESRNNESRMSGFSRDADIAVEDMTRALRNRQSFEPAKIEAMTAKYGQILTRIQLEVTKAMYQADRVTRVGATEVYATAARLEGQLRGL